jgi:acyl-CoA thioester hydrolase
MTKREPTPAVSGWVDGWYVVPHEVTWQDVDAMGHVNNAVYFAYFEWARTKFWLEMMGSVDPRAIGFIVARAECDFRHELALMDLLHIGTRISETRSTSLDFSYVVKKASTGEVAATGKVIVVLYSWTEREKVPITASLRERIVEFQSGK